MTYYSVMRARVYRLRPGTWVYEAGVIGGSHELIYLTDNTGAWRPMLDGALRDVEALRRIYSAGHYLRDTWDDLMEREVDR